MAEVVVSVAVPAVVQPKAMQNGVKGHKEASGKHSDGIGSHEAGAAAGQEGVITRTLTFLVVVMMMMLPVSPHMKLVVMGLIVVLCLRWRNNRNINSEPASKNILLEFYD
ncbi:hypothetical protein Cni_G23548 [Canna indica]|uniref:Transmembrane protein n=1 Tax=Canna indica TaxID=4628 RepID=A0AAQ3KWC5_9LILI|nr:hypothetical protein Cni_G23548 [Canna indica]